MSTQMVRRGAIALSSAGIGSILYAIDSHYKSQKTRTARCIAGWMENSPNESIEARKMAIRHCQPIKSLTEGMLFDNLFTTCLGVGFLTSALVVYKKSPQSMIKRASKIFTKHADLPVKKIIMQPLSMAGKLDALTAEYVKTTDSSGRTIELGKAIADVYYYQGKLEEASDLLKSAGKTSSEQENAKLLELQKKTTVEQEQFKKFTECLEKPECIYFQHAQEQYQKETSSSSEG